MRNRVPSASAVSTLDYTHGHEPFHGSIFFSRLSDLTSLPHTCPHDQQAGFDLGMKNGMIVAVPNPSPAAGGAQVDAAIRVALSEAESRGLTGRDVTPFVLARVNEETGGESLKSNVALVRSTTGLWAEEIERDSGREGRLKCLTGIE